MLVLLKYFEFAVKATESHNFSIETFKHHLISKSYSDL